MLYPEMIDVVVSGYITLLEKKMELTQIGFAVRTARQAARMSAKELASIVTLTPAALSKIENGTQNLDFKTAINIARALKTEIGHLASLAESVEDVGIEATDIKRQLALRLKCLEKKAIKTAIALNHGVEEITRSEDKKVLSVVVSKNSKEKYIDEECHSHA
jgi:transcriptional regulator with XRE-family HTH domain